MQRYCVDPQRLSSSVGEKRFGGEGWHPYHNTRRNYRTPLSRASTSSVVVEQCEYHRIIVLRECRRACYTASRTPLPKLIPVGGARIFMKFGTLPLS